MLPRNLLIFLAALGSEQCALIARDASLGVGVSAQELLGELGVFVFAVIRDTRSPPTASSDPSHEVVEIGLKAASE